MDLEKYKQVISEAIEGEIAARKFYADVSNRIKDDYLKELFANFAREEAGHEAMLTRMLEENRVKSAGFDTAKDFHVSETIDMPMVDENMNLKDAIAIAMKNEQAAMEKYTSLAANCDDPDLKAVFLDLAAMERDHKHKMESSFVDVAYPEIW